MIKKATIFGAELFDDHNELDELITEDKTTKYPELSQRITCGFIPVFGDVYVNNFSTGYQFSMQIWEKKISNQVVNRLTNERCEGFSSITRNDKLRIKDEVVAELVQNTHAVSRIIRCFYHIASKLLIIESTTSGDTDRVMGKLLDTVGSIETKTLNISHTSGLTNLLEERIQCIFEDEKDAFELFNEHEITGLLRLKSPCKETIELKGMSWNELEYSSLRDIEGSITNGFEVDKIRLSTGSIEFTLDEKFKFSSIKFPSFEEDEEIENVKTKIDSETIFCIDRIVNSANIMVEQFKVVDNNG